MTPTAHPFEPSFKGVTCGRLTYVDHRAVPCGAEASDLVHTGTRTAPPELEFPTPPCSLCDKDTYHDGDGFRCDPCGASWSPNGRDGSWDEPDLKVCTSTHKPFDNDALKPEHEGIRHHVIHCILPLDHDGRHSAGGYRGDWDDDQALAVTQ